MTSGMNRILYNPAFSLNGERRIVTTILSVNQQRATQLAFWSGSLRCPLSRRAFGRAGDVMLRIVRRVAATREVAEIECSFSSTDASDFPS